MAELINDSNPLVALLSQPYHSTALDKEIHQFDNPKTRQEDPIIVIDEDSNNTTNNISLSFRQPSFSSLTEIPITKGGDVVDTDLPNLLEDSDPIIVFDRNSQLNKCSSCLAYNHPETRRKGQNSYSSENDNDEPITLSIRQPSFSSLFGQIVPKGCESLSTFEPILEEVQPSPLSQETMNQILSDEDDPQIILMQEFKAKNEKRWKEIGYEPPEHLFHRASSHQSDHNFLLSSNNAPIAQSHEVFTSSPNNIRRRSGDNQSFGLKLGQMQNQSIEMMHEIIQYDPTVQEMTLEEIPDEEEMLFGRLNELDEELLLPIRKTLSSGSIEVDNIADIKKHLRIVADKCIDNLWIEETAYLNDLLSRTNQEYNQNYGTTGFLNFDRTKFGFWKENPEQEIKRIKCELEREIEETFNVQLAELEQKKTETLQELENKYLEESRSLDEKFQDPNYLQALPFAKPSKQLLDMRYTAKKLLKQNRINEAKALKNRIVETEKAEEMVISSKVAERYHFEDRRLKDDYAKKRSTILQKFNKEHDRIIKERNERIQIYQKKITILERQIAEDKEYEQNMMARSQRTKTSNKIDSNNQESSELKIGQLVLKPPKKLNRENDILILENMTNALLSQSSGISHKIDIDEIFRKTIK